MRLVGHVFPFQDEPEHHGGEQRGERVYLSLYRRKPECVAERVGQCAHHAAAYDGEYLPRADVLLVRHHQLARQVRDAPEQEEYAGRAHQRAHVVYHLGHLGGVARELREQVGHQHEERCPRRVPYFQLVAGGDELRAIPEACGGFYGEAIHHGRNEESHPTREVVDEFVLFHYRMRIVITVSKPQI